MKKFYSKDCPETLQIVNWLKSQTDWVSLMNTIKPREKYPPMISFKIDNFDSEKVKNSILDATKIYGDFGWRSAQGSSSKYTGFSLVYNPNHQDSLDIHASTLGTPKNNKDEFFWMNTEKHSVLKDSYFDGYSFNSPTPASEHGALGEFLKRVKRTRIRSRVSIINGPEFTPGKPRWHRDEPVFENLRINIPVLTTPDYFFQLENYDPANLPVGRAYSWDTNVPHTVFNTAKSDTRRIHIVLGFSPWWDYDPDEQSWFQNEFYGVKHPFDMLVDGDVMSGLTFDPDTKIYK